MRRCPLDENELLRHLKCVGQAMVSGFEDGKIDKECLRKVVRRYNDFCFQEGVNNVLTQATALTLEINRLKPIVTDNTESNINRVAAVACGINLLMQEADFPIFCPASFLRGFVSYLEFEEILTPETIREYYQDLWEYCHEIAQK